MLICFHLLMLVAWICCQTRIKFFTQLKYQCLILNECEMDVEKQEILNKRIVEPMEHHKQLSVCETRPAYRQGRKLTAVKVYTINDESQHLLIFGVPSINLLEEVKRTCSKYGTVKSIKIIYNYPGIEEFTQVYHVNFVKLTSARFAKKKLDATSFFGGLLHVCYAPEMETVEETREKLVTRRKQVHFKLKLLKAQEKEKKIQENTT